MVRKSIGKLIFYLFFINIICITSIWITFVSICVHLLNIVFQFDLGHAFNLNRKYCKPLQTEAHVIQLKNSSSNMYC